MTLPAQRPAEITVVSPHRDDAAFSCGIVMYAALEIMAVRIVNIFTQSTYAPFDEAAEQTGIDAVSELRRSEDTAFIQYLCSQTANPAQLNEIHLGLLDAPLRLHLKTDAVQGESLNADEYEREVQALAAILHPLLKDSECVLLPLGLGGHALDGHIDHRIARDAGRRCAAPGCIAFYEDLPYAARMLDAERESAILAFIASLKDVQPLFVCRDDAGELKSELSRFYASQVDAGTIEEIATYTKLRPGECVYAASEARRVLANL